LFEELCFPKIHIYDRGALASRGPFDAKARERREVLGVQRGKDEMVCDGCSADEAIQYAHPMTQMAASKPFQSRVRNLLGAMEEPILAHFPGHRALLPTLAAACQSCNIGDHRYPPVLRHDTVHPRDGRRMPPKEIHEDGRFDQMIIGGHRVGLLNADEAATQR
jgi:hypothetical protein